MKKKQTDLAKCRSRSGSGNAISCSVSNLIVFLQNYEILVFF